MQPSSLLQLLQQHGIATRSRVYTRHEYLFHDGSTTTDIYYIERGAVQVCIPEEPEDHIIRFGYSGNIILALDAFLNTQPTVFYMQALKKTSVQIIRKEDLMQFIYATPEHMRLWIQILESLVLQQIERETDLLMSAPTTRYTRVLQRSPGLFQEVPHKYIARYLRMSPETLSRLKKS